MEYPRTVLARFQETADLGHVGNEIGPGADFGTVKTDDGPLGARIPLQLTNGHIRMHLFLHHFTDHKFYGKQNAD